MSRLGPELPEDIWQHIHSLMPLQDAARAACISRAFLSAWRRHPNLTLTEQSLGCSDFTKKVDHILKNHSGVGVKKLDLEIFECYNADDINHLDSWLQIAVTPWIEELTLKVCPDWFSDDECSAMQMYKFPSSVLSCESRSSIQFLELESCEFRPTVQIGRLGSLTKLHLHYVRITGDELGCFLSSSLVLERLELTDCCEIICLKIPSILRHLTSLHVYGCGMMKEIENKAQNLHAIYFGGFPALYSPGQSLRLGELLQLQKIDMWCNDAVYYACAELPSIAPNLETLTISSLREMVNAPTTPSKFLHLKYLCINLVGVKLSPPYDYFSLASIVDSSLSLETFILNLPQELMEDDWNFGCSSDLRQMPQCRHHNLQNFEITGFGSAKSLVELTCYILESTSLERVTLDTTLLGAFRCSDRKYKKCFPVPSRGIIIEVQKALLAIKTYIETKVPATVKLTVVEPCRRCH
ncbi:unnamed protein product [Urochloa decumbens]|uniref:F-box domain-containing protein n=1 Tax=Urochloa decumbens TaxID=240449 RepID=A0ABC9G4L8_9POAL